MLHSDRWSRLFTEILRFGIVGAIGFLIDSSILYLLTRNGMNPLVARCVSFPIALGTTWLLNSRWTFTADQARLPRSDQRMRYAGTQLIGLIINYTTFAVALRLLGSTSLHAVLALAIASVLAMLFNFAGARYFVFRSN
jgi:putative flippase GtrA